MDHTSNKSEPTLLHVHVCMYCASIFRREEVEGRVHTTGLFICTRCGREGQLNITIQEVGDDVSQIPGSD